MEMDRFPGRIWVVAHKPVAVAAGLGQMGLHRCVIHPQFGNFILLGTILVDPEITPRLSRWILTPASNAGSASRPVRSALSARTATSTSSPCATHNYREFLGGFTDWAETIADSTDTFEFRSRVGHSETASMWQSLSFGPNYKAAYCVAVCPAGEEVIEPYLDDRKEIHGSGSEAVAGQARNAVCVAQFRRQSVRRKALPA